MAPALTATVTALAGPRVSTPGSALGISRATDWLFAGLVSTLGDAGTGVGLGR